MNEGLAHPDGPEDCQPDAVYHFLADVASLRSKMQHKCVEMSLQITTGLAVGVFAVMYHELSNSPNPTATISVFSSSPAKVCLVIVIELYTILQLLVLANYLYHSFQASIIQIYLAELNPRHVKAIHKSLLHTLHTTPNPEETRSERRASILNRFQPLIIYFSASIGIVACLGFGLWLFFPPTRFWWLLVIIPIPLCFLLWWMYRTHTLLNPLARTRTRFEIEQWEATKQSPEA